MLRWLLGLLILAAGFFYAGGRLARSWDDVHRYAGVDLSNRLGAARTLDEGADPYTVRDLNYGRPGSPRWVKRWNEHPYAPPLIWAYVPLGRLAWPDAREWDFWIEWGALAAAVMLGSLAFTRGGDRLIWIGAAMALVTSQFSWRLHVERGQAYVFLTLLLAAGLVLVGRKTKQCDGRFSSFASLFGSFLGASLIGIAAATRPSLAVILLLLPLCGRWRAALVGIAAAGAVYGLTLLAGPGGYWPGYVRVVDLLELETLRPGSIAQADPEIQFIYDPTIRDAYEMPNAEKRLRSRSPSLVANTVLWPDLYRRYGWPKRAECPKLSKEAAVMWVAVTAIVLIGLWLRRATALERLAVLAAMGLGVDFFLPMRYEYADVLYLVPLGLCLAALRQRGQIVLPLLILGATALSYENPDVLGYPDSVGAIWRVLTMVVAPVLTLLVITGARSRAPLTLALSDTCL